MGAHWGTSEAYTLAFSTLADAGDTVLLPRPGYPLFEHLAGHARLEAAYYDQTWATGWKPDAASLERGLSRRTRFVAPISNRSRISQPASWRS